MRFLSITCALIFLNILNLQASENQEYKATILLITRSQEQNSREPISSTITARDLQLQHLIENSIKLTLEQAGLEVISSRDLANILPKQIKITNKEVFDPVVIFQLADQVQADFTLTSSFVNLEKEIELRLHWYNVRQAVLVSTIIKKLGFGLSFDEAVSLAVEELLFQRKQEIASLTPLLRKPLPDNSTLSQKENDKIPDSTPTSEPEPSTDKQQKASLIDPGFVPRLPDKSDNIVNKHKEPPTHLAFLAGFAPFLSIGNVSDYFKLSYAPTLSLDFLINLTGGQLGLGIYASMNVFQVDEITESGTNYFLPLGAEMRFETSTKPLRFYVRIAGGPAIMSVNFTNTEPNNTLIVFLLGGIGISLPFNTHLGLAFDSSFITYIDHGETIMGYMPGSFLFLKL